MRGCTQLDSFMKTTDEHLGDRGKRTARLSKFCFIKISSKKILQETLFYSFCLLYILLVQKNFDSSESILSVFVESGHGKHVADNFKITKDHLTADVIGKITSIFN